MNAAEERLRLMSEKDWKLAENPEALEDLQTLGIPLSFAAVDLETTGLDPKRDHIIEIGAVRVEQGQIAGRYQQLVNPGCPISGVTADLTGITDEMVQDAPLIGEIWQEFREFCGELPIVGHQVNFDYRFLKRAAVNQGESFERSGIDTLELCRAFMPAEEKKNLTAACAYFGIEREQAHRAQSDAQDAGRLYAEMAVRFGRMQAERFAPKPLIYKIKRDQPASEKQKEDLRYFIKYHKISLPVRVEELSRSEASRLRDRLILQYGRIPDSGKRQAKKKESVKDCERQRNGDKYGQRQDQR